MADPATLILIAAGASAATTVAGGFAADAQGQYESDLAKANARLVRQRAEQEAAARAREARQQLGMARAGAASRGVVFGGSALDVAAQEQVDAELEERFIMHRGEIRALSLEQRGKQAKRAGRLKLIGSVGSAGGTLLTGTAGAMAAGSGGGATGTAGGGGGWVDAAVGAGVS